MNIFESLRTVYALCMVVTNKFLFCSTCSLVKRNTGKKLNKKQLKYFV